MSPLRGYKTIENICLPSVRSYGALLFYSLFFISNFLFLIPPLRGFEILCLILISGLHPELPICRPFGAIKQLKTFVYRASDPTEPYFFIPYSLFLISYFLSRPFGALKNFASF